MIFIIMTFCNLDIGSEWKRDEKNNVPKNVVRIFSDENLGLNANVFFPILEMPQDTTPIKLKQTLQVFSEDSRGYELLDVEAVVANDVAEVYETELS